MADAFSTWQYQHPLDINKELWSNFSSVPVPTFTKLTVVEKLPSIKLPIWHQLAFANCSWTMDLASTQKATIALTRAI